MIWDELTSKATRDNLIVKEFVHLNLTQDKPK